MLEPSQSLNTEFSLINFFNRTESLVFLNLHMIAIN